MCDVGVAGVSWGMAGVEVGVSRCDVGVAGCDAGMAGCDVGVAGCEVCVCVYWCRDDCTLVIVLVLQMRCTFTSTSLRET